eukprot:CAMPEP_0183709920 /NCGR_PEP_ID=MMETSP0737-20130205/5856_1 /TAXON_ID=385413 /ORGANISM="Thalassiosira miniscula, Strain CCMP1093" /LENGTH=278 /DNA_ID=CAMNT_0025938139 /DNA_START=54 /DNA_END=890 /DNA_ORIENTATION=+
MTKSNRSLFTQGLVLLTGIFLGRLSSTSILDPSSFFCNDIETRVETVAVVSSKSNHKFDVMRSNLYNFAIDAQPPKLRTKYRLGTVPQSGGGLHDTDRLLVGALYYNATSVFEFGLGESTMIAAHVGVPRYAGVDSDAVWVTMARDNSNMDHFRFSFADIGPTGLWGYPNNTKLNKIPLEYQIAALNNEMAAFDVYLVDGRYRTACACASMLHALGRGGKRDKVLVGMHDWGRESYKRILEVADMVEQSKRLAVFKIKKNTTEEDLFNLWERLVWTSE